MQKWLTGDMGAFEDLFRQYERLVFKTAYLITGNKEAADDALQEVFISVWKSRHTYKPDRGKLTTWLRRITVNHCMSRRQKQQPATLPLEERKPDMPEIKHQPRPEDVLINKMEYDRLLKATDALDTEHRSVLVLRYFDDLSYQEMAEVLEIPLGTVKSRLSQSLRYIKEQMNLGEAKA
jgi:RNA polymerase sigma factor (sigma-70 family)